MADPLIERGGDNRESLRSKGRTPDALCRGHIIIVGRNSANLL